MPQPDTTGQIFAIRYPPGLAGRDEGYTNDKVLVQQILQNINVNFGNQDLVPEDTRWRVFMYSGNYDSVKDKTAESRALGMANSLLKAVSIFSLGEEGD
jgi:hypothetical protein